MFLLDHNFPVQILEFLQGQGVQVQTTRYHGWEALENGALVSSAFEAGYRCVLTRDRKFAESAAKALRKFPEISVIIVTLQQNKADVYLASFQAAWGKDKILPLPGQLLLWPK
jgi:predicted nuclease of predicted toxin-antitoxin system